jgi:hypothetical protein
MKKILFLVFGFLNVFLSFGQMSISIVPIITQTTDYIQLIEQKYNQQIMHLEYDVVKDYKEVFVDLFVDVQYGIIIFGDENMQNVDLKISVFDGNNWIKVAEDTKTDGIVMLYFNPPSTNFYRFELSVELKDPNSFSFYSLLMFR